MERPGGRPAARDALPTGESLEGCCIGEVASSVRRPRPHGFGGKRVRKRSGARRRRFANDVWITSLPNRLLAVDRKTPGAGLVDSTNAGGRVYRASRLR